MIDRRHFVQSLLVLGAATGLRPSTVLFGFPPSGELRDLADAALAAAKTAGATYADIAAFMFKANGSPAGKAELPTDRAKLREILVVSR